MSINDRLRKLEKAAALTPGGPCPECGFPEPDPSKIKFVTTFEGDEPVGPPRPEFCQTCGEQLVFKCSFDDMGDGLAPNDAGDTPPGGV
ncbi:MAG: hypothetical protein WCI73_02535 [Phycisphaerae bacterium]